MTERINRIAYKAAQTFFIRGDAYFDALDAVVEAVRPILLAEGLMEAAKLAARDDEGISRYLVARAKELDPQ